MGEIRKLEVSLNSPIFERIAEFTMQLESLQVEIEVLKKGIEWLEKGEGKDSDLVTEGWSFPQLSPRSAPHHFGVQFP